MTAEALLSINVPVLFYVTANSDLTLQSLVQAKKEAVGIEDTLSMDINNDGAVNDTDLTVIRKTLLELI